MTLRELIAGAGLDPSMVRGPGDGSQDTRPDDEAAAQISGLSYRSDKVVPGALFFCIPGFTVDGHDFAPDAVDRGAAALVCERPLGLGVPELVVESVRAVVAPLAASFYGNPTADIEVVGVTGTNGKTTTTFLIREVLEAAGRRTGLLGTVHAVVGGRVEDVERTTPEAIDLQHAFRRMVDAGDDSCVIEVSSHGLELGRADAIRLDCAVFTNLSRDHLDLHGTIERYFGAKRRMFMPTASPAPRRCVINVDDECGRRLAAELAETGHRHLVTFAVDRDADYRAESIESGAAGTRFVLRGTEQEGVEVHSPLPGLFNVYNVLGALATAGSLGVGVRGAVDVVAAAGRVPGRFESIDVGQDFTVVIDYAHTPDSLANVLRTSRDILERGDRGRLVCVFGAGGDRDADKRPLMGEVACRLADHLVVTSDNPRSEDPGAIIAAIVEGAEHVAAAEAEASTLEVEPDRRAAIARALGLARAGDLVLIAGKGHEQGQELGGGRKIPFDDRDVAREELRRLRLGSAQPSAR